MIKNVHIENFQGHKDSFFEFDKGTNVIIGKTDAGKSSIIRAMNWCLFNKPRSDSYIRDTMKWCSVEIEFEGGNVVKRFRSDKENYYILNGEKFKAFGTEPPIKILQAHNMTDLNLNKQLDSHFLLSQSSSSISQKLNKIANLELIDTALSSINSKIRNNKADSKYAKIEEQKLKQKLEKYEFLPALKKKVAKIEKKELLLEEKIQRESKLTELILKYESLAKQNSYKKGIKELSKQVDSAIITCTKHNTINKLLRKQRDIAIFKQKYTKIPLYKKAVDKALKIAKSIDEEELRLCNINLILNNYNAVQNEKEALKSFIKRNTTIYKKNMGEACPLCGKKL